MTGKQVTPTAFCEVRQARGRLARSTGLHGPDHPQTEAARAAFRSEKYLAAVRAAVADAPELDCEARSRLASILRPVIAFAGAEQREAVSA